MRIFLGFSFRETDKPFVQRTQQLLESLSTQVVTGKRLGGEALTDEVKRRIAECDALIGLLTRRDELASGGWTTHEWMKQELQYARDKSIPAIALVEDGVAIEGMAAPYEHIPFVSGDLLDPLLILAENVALWRRQVGRMVKVRILPNDLGQRACNEGAGITCEQRLWLNGKPTTWKPVIPQPEEGGAFIYVENVQEDQLLQIAIREAGKTWQSPAAAQWLSVQLAQEAP